MLPGTIAVALLYLLPITSSRFRKQIVLMLGKSILSQWFLGQNKTGFFNWEDQESGDLDSGPNFAQCVTFSKTGSFSFLHLSSKENDTCLIYLIYCPEKSNDVRNVKAYWILGFSGKVFVVTENKINLEYWGPVRKCLKEPCSFFSITGN